MLIDFLKLYFIYLVLVSAIFSFMLLRVRLKRPVKLFALLIVILFAPGLTGYFMVMSTTPWPELGVPNVVGLELSEAEIKLSQAGLKGYEGGTVFDSNISQGRVALQKPEAGRKVKSGRPIELFVSSGKRTTVVPNLLGRQLNQAQPVLVAANLSLGDIEKQAAEDMSPDIILSQIPLPGEQVEVGIAINLVISASKEAMSEEPRKEGGFWFW